MELAQQSIDPTWFDLERRCDLPPMARDHVDDDRDRATSLTREIPEASLPEPHTSRIATVRLDRCPRDLVEDDQAASRAQEARRFFEHDDGIDVLGRLLK